MPEQLQYVHAELSVAKIQHYEGLAQKFLDEFGASFRDFVEDLFKLRRRGDYRIKTIGATGYNILRTSAAMDLQSNEMIVFYNNNIHNPHHFGLLLAELDHEKLITEEEMTFGVKASSVLYDYAKKYQTRKQWELPPTATVRKIKRRDNAGHEDEVIMQDTLDLVLAIKVRGEEHAKALANFFDRRTKKDDETEYGKAAIDRSWYVPDIRATNNLNEYLVDQRGYIPIIANLGKMGPARLIVLNKKKFHRRQDGVPILVNKELAKYLIGFDVEE